MTTEEAQAILSKLLREEFYPQWEKVEPRLVMYGGWTKTSVNPETGKLRIVLCTEEDALLAAKSGAPPSSQDDLFR